MKKIRYPDLWLRLIGIPVMAVLIQEFSALEPLYERLSTKKYYLDLGWNIVLVLVIWQTNRFIVQLLDKRYSWIHQRFTRFIIQSGLAFGISFIEVVGLTFLYRELLVNRSGIFNMNLLMTLDLSLTFIFVSLINCAYAGLYLVKYYHLQIERLKYEREEAIRIAENLKLDRLYNENSELKQNNYQEHLLVNYGHASVPVLSQDIAYVFRTNEMSFLRTFEGKEYTSGSSIESLETLLNPAEFFRINSQMLAHVRSIRKFKADINGKLEVEFTPPFLREVFISKKKAPEFKEWIGKKI